MVIMNDTNSTNVTAWIEGSTATMTYTSCYCDDYDYEQIYIDIEVEAVRFGWYNPRKIKLIKKPFVKRIPIKIRNQLPYKMRDG